MGQRRVSTGVLCALCLIMVLLPGCPGSLGSRNAAFKTWGSPGRAKGEFRQPRAVGVHKNEVYVVDKTGRVQVFSPEGEFLRDWAIPDASNGTPTGIVFGSDDTVYVPDTHYSRILEYDTKGTLLQQWGTYGTGESEFIYPTDLALGTNGTHFISEYGMGAERVHVFDAERAFVRQWGAHGREEGLLSRAMAICVDDEGMVLVCDTANHRIQCFDSKGVLLRIVGGGGTEPGKLKLPYDIALAPDGSLIVCEHGNNRLSRFDHDGKFMECYGGPGRELGRFHAPRGVAVDDDGRVFVADTGNNRIQSFQLALAVPTGGERK